MIGHSLTKTAFSCISKIRIIKSTFRNKYYYSPGLDSEILIEDNTGVAARCSLYSASNAYARDKRMSGQWQKKIMCIRNMEKF